MENVLGPDIIICLLFLPPRKRIPCAFALDQLCLLAKFHNQSAVTCCPPGFKTWASLFQTHIPASSLASKGKEKSWK